MFIFALQELQAICFRITKLRILSTQYGPFCQWIFTNSLGMILLTTPSSAVDWHAWHVVQAVHEPVLPAGGDSAAVAHHCGRQPGGHLGASHHHLFIFRIQGKHVRAVVFAVVIMLILLPAFSIFLFFVLLYEYWFLLCVTGGRGWSAALARGQASQRAQRVGRARWLQSHGTPSFILVSYWAFEQKLSLMKHVHFCLLSCVLCGILFGHVAWSLQSIAHVVLSLFIYLFIQN